jgi:hypothetical protein
LLGIDIDGLDPDRHALETNPDPDPAKYGDLTLSVSGNIG